jgi:hypothetical protein
MARLNSAELRERVVSAGVAYLPAEQVFYSNFPYKVELSPKFKGLGGVSGKRGCQIDVSDPVKARVKLDEFVDKMNKIFLNVECRNEIKEFVERLPRVEYKSRMGGENNLFYFRDPDFVMLLVEKYGDLINNVTGPISSEHEDVISESNIIMRDHLYYGRFRYLLEFNYNQDFADRTAIQLKEYLAGLDPQTWRAHRLDSCINYYRHQFNRTSPITNGQPTVIMQRAPAGRTRRTKNYPILSAAMPRSQAAPHRRIQIYLTDGNDYIYIKLLAAEHVMSNHEIVLFSELK